MHEGMKEEQKEMDKSKSLPPEEVLQWKEPRKEGRSDSEQLCIVERNEFRKDSHQTTHLLWATNAPASFPAANQPKKASDE